VKPAPIKPLFWLGSSKKDLWALPVPVRKFFGHVLDTAQRGEQHEAVKVLSGFGSAGVLEIIEDDSGSTYRTVYTVRFSEAVFVLHVFQKKSKRGIETPKPDMDIIRQRLKAAAIVAQELKKMTKRIVAGVEIEASSSNVFADLGLPDAEKLQIKSGLTTEIAKAIRERGLTQVEAAQRMGLTQPKVSSLLRGEFSNLSERKLMDCLNRLGYDIEIRLRKTPETVGHLMLTHA